jgi:CheY-like chemotaxis protein
MGVSVAFEVSDEKLTINAVKPVDIPRLPELTHVDTVQLSGEYAIVDDLETSREYLKFVLRQAGAKVKSFNSGGALLQSLKRGEQYTAILLDLHMPEVSGIETMSMVKAIYKDNDTPIIMISADVELLNRWMAENAHIEQVFAKPIDPQRLTDTLYRLENQARIREQKYLKVLLIEDDEISADFVGEMLKSFGYRVLIANTGEAAKNAVGRHRFDVALIDLILPDASGYDIAKYFTDTLEQDEQPVMIALTGNTLESDKQKSLAAGMKYHLCKPVSVAELKKSIELSVNLRALIAQRWCRAAAQRIIAVVKKTTKPDKTCSRSRWQQRYRLLRD